MTIDINKVRVQLDSDGIIDHIELHANLKPTLTTFPDRLEAAEGERDWRADRCEDAMSECASLRAKVEAMGRQEQSEQDESVRKSWARFSHELHRSPDAPYPGMADAFEQHFSQSFTDREWRAEAATWAAAWKAAKRHGTQPAPSVPDGVAEALQRLIENNTVSGLGSSEDALLVARYRRHLLACAPSVPTALLVAVADLVAQMEIVSRVGFVDTPDDKDSCAAFCVAEGTWLELMSAVESLASAAGEQK